MKQWCKHWQLDPDEYCSVQGQNFDCNKCPYYQDIRNENNEDHETQ